MESQKDMRSVQDTLAKGERQEGKRQKELTKHITPPEHAGIKDQVKH